jgi:hypothetical protein
MGCECGAYKVYGTKRGERGHSAWCPWSKDLPMCEGVMYATMCGRQAEFKACFSIDNDHFYYYCSECFEDVQRSIQVSSYEKLV